MTKNSLNGVVSSYIKANLNELSLKIMNRQYDKQPELQKVYDGIRKHKFLDDIMYNLSFLSSAVSVDNKGLYLNYMDWLGGLMRNIGLPLKDLTNHFECTTEVLTEQLSREGAKLVSEYVKEGVSSFKKAYLKKNSPVKENDTIDTFLGYLLNSQKDNAIRYVMKELEKGKGIKYIYLNLIQPALYKIGELWECQKISVAKEHYCTAVIQNIISLMYPQLFNEKKNGKTLVSACAGNELHEIGIRMVTDFFELDGWDTFYLGSNVPIDGIVQELIERRADLAAISTTISSNLGFMVSLINKIREDKRLSNLKIIVGGRPFNQSKGLWKTVGADGYGINAEESVFVGNSLVRE